MRKCCVLAGVMLWTMGGSLVGAQAPVQTPEPVFNQAKAIADLDQPSPARKPLVTEVFKNITQYKARRPAGCCASWNWGFPGRLA